MKRIFITFAGVFAMMFSANAQQFSNAGFETWSSSKPSNWQGLEFYSFDVTDGAISQSTDRHSGNYAVKLKPANLNQLVITALQMFGGLDAETLEMLQAVKIPAFITNGQIDVLGLIELLSTSGGDFSQIDITSLGNYITNGLAISAMPANIGGWIKFNGSGEDAYVLFALCYAGTGTERHIVGVGAYYSEMYTGPESNWHQFIAQVVPTNNETPTELIFIAVSLSGNNTTEPVLLLDDVEINATVGLTDVQKNSINVYPNPSNGTFSIICANGSKVVVTNMLGQEVLSVSNYVSGSSLSIDKCGMYFVNVSNGESQITKKVIVK